MARLARFPGAPQALGSWSAIVAGIVRHEAARMCRSIQPLHNYEPSAGADEVRAAALQYVRKISGMTRPARVNQAAFDAAVERIAAATQELLAGLVATAPPRDRTAERQRARVRWEQRRERGAA
jgi:hypothetical protein